MAKAALPILLGAGAIAVLSSKKKAPVKPRFGLQVNQSCKVELVDEDRYKSFLRGGYLEEIEDNPGYGPLEIAAALFADVAPHCHHFPGQPESMDVYRLYLNILGHVSNFLVDDGKMKPAQILELREDVAFVAWSNKNLETLGEKWGSIPENQVGFAKDYSEYRVGALWEEETLAPFVIQGKKEGLDNQAIYDAFVTKKNVMVGESKFVRIADLPQGAPAVQEFHERVIKGIEAAE